MCVLSCFDGCQTKCTFVPQKTEMSNKRAGTPNTQAPPKKRKLAIRDDVLNLTEPHPNYNTDITKILLRIPIDPT